MNNQGTSQEQLDSLRDMIRNVSCPQSLPTTTISSETFSFNPPASVVFSVPELSLPPLFRSSSSGLSLSSPTPVPVSTLLQAPVFSESFPFLQNQQQTNDFFAQHPLQPSTPNIYDDNYIRTLISNTQRQHSEHSAHREQIQRANHPELIVWFVDALLGRIDNHETLLCLYKKAKELMMDPSLSTQLNQLIRTFVTVNCKKFTENDLSSDETPVARIGRKIVDMIFDGQTSNSQFQALLEQLAAMTSYERQQLQQSLTPAVTPDGKTFSFDLQQSFLNPMQTILDQYRVADSVPLNLQSWLQQIHDNLSKLARELAITPQCSRQNISEAFGSLSSIVSVLGIALGQVAPDTRRILNFNNWGGLTQNYVRAALESKTNDRFRLSQSALQKAKAITAKTRLRPRVDSQDDRKDDKRPRLGDR